MQTTDAVTSVAVNFVGTGYASADIGATLKPLATPGNAVFASAGELVAHAYLDQGKRAEAGALFAQIAKDENSPESARSRARQMAGVLGVDAIETEMSDLDIAWLDRKLGLYGLVTPNGTRRMTKIGSGKKLWNYDNLEPTEKKLVL